MIEEDTFKTVVQHACFSADTVAVGFSGTGAERTRATITRALEALEANGIITINDPNAWPNYYTPDPPYKSFL